MKTASDLTVQDVVAAWNNLELTNAAVVETLDTTWDAIKTKIRVNKSLQGQLTVDRQGGVNGTFQAMTVEAVAAVAPEEAVFTDIIEQTAPTTPPVQQAASAEVAGVFSFTAVVKNNSTGETVRHTIPGPTRPEAFEQIKQILMQTTNTIAEDEQGNFITFDQIQPGQTIYILDKLSKAAGEA